MVVISQHFELGGEATQDQDPASRKTRWDSVSSGSSLGVELLRSLCAHDGEQEGEDEEEVQFGQVRDQMQVSKPFEPISFKHTPWNLPKDVAAHNLCRLARKLERRNLIEKLSLRKRKRRFRRTMQNIKRADFFYLM